MIWGMTNDLAAPHLLDDRLDDAEEILAEIERAVRHATSRPELHLELAEGFRRGYGMRDAFLKRDLIQDQPLPPGAIWIILAQHAEALSESGEQMAALGYTFVSLVTKLEEYSRDHPQRERTDALRWRAAAVLEQVGPEVADARARTIKGPDVNTTRH